MAGEIIYEGDKRPRDLAFTWRDGLGIHTKVFPMADAWLTEAEAWRVINKYRPKCWVEA